jgi:hypothetical protein
MSLRARWALSIGVAVVLLVALVSYVSGHNTDAPQGQPISNRAEVEANREATILVQQDQAAQISRAAAHVAPAQALARAVAAEMRARIGDGQADPPLARAHCTATAGAGARRGFSCRVLAGGVYYDFVGVLDSGTRAITLCKSDPPPVPTQTVPVSRRCQA